MFNPPKAVRGLFETVCGRDAAVAPTGVRGGSRRRARPHDDEPLNITLLAHILKGPYKVKVANNGERALKIAASGDPPDLVLLDVMMPVMDGHDEICFNTDQGKAHQRGALWWGVTG